MDECDEKNAISLSWGRREIRISGERATLYVNGVPHDMTMMLETIRGAGTRPERISPAKWISLLRGRPTADAHHASDKNYKRYFASKVMP